MQQEELAKQKELPWEELVKRNREKLARQMRQQL